MKADLLRAWAPPAKVQTYDSRDSMLYALSIGLGRDPMDPRALPFVYEKDQQAFPCMAAILATPGFWMRDHPEFEIDHRRIVHGEQHLRLYADLPPSGSVSGQTLIARIIDKGPGKPAIIHAVRELSNCENGSKIAAVEQVYVYRGGGGFSQEGDHSDGPATAPEPAPDRRPDRVLTFQTRADSALLYRLSGDYNPLHADPEVARQAGFERPILHGLASYAMVAKSILWDVADGDVRTLRAYSARMSAPALPGDMFEIRCWIDNPCEITFEVAVPDRDVVILGGGKMVLGQ
ncbi:MaoC/PaaZ C-terminal domain-containing protein [uncultured Sphingobium sp.]|uniref:MaoC/PaaZ C-terminal domain-containing protein n=1 Tax=uncultured Sphingobium sp. TaxID=316087 RepID=UPI0026258CED|nr:MaoC/PaaZ C-terminal domain-containing protein [uncultured Sphingobium sp.]